MQINYLINKNTLLKVLTTLIIILSAQLCIFSQNEDKENASQQIINSFHIDSKYGLSGNTPQTLNQSQAVKLPALKELDFVKDDFEKHSEITKLNFSEIKSEQKLFLKKEFQKRDIDKINDFAEDFKEAPKKSQTFQKAEKFHWKPAINESLYFLAIQQSFRMVQKKTRRELTGKFFADWGKSVKNLGGWRDGDSFATNYIAHPMQGAVTGRIFINNSDSSKKLEFGKTKDYWKSRAKALAWSAVWSTQFELGPISEASIGNVGLYDDTGPNRMGWVDMVVTPVAGTGVIVGEDMIDKYILKKWLECGSSRTKIKIYRTFFTPFQSFTNVLRLKAPWKRDNR